MSLRDTIEMLHKRASGGTPDPEHHSEVKRKLALEMEKQALIGDLAGRLAWFLGQTVPETAGRAIGHVVKYPAWGAARAAKAGLGAAGRAGASVVSHAAALPFDHPAMALTGAAMTYDLAQRMKQLRALGDVASDINPPRIQWGRRD